MEYSSLFQSLNVLLCTPILSASPTQESFNLAATFDKKRCCPPGEKMTLLTNLGFNSSEIQKQVNLKKRGFGGVY